MSPVALLARAAPVVPDGDEAREWAEHELGDPIYRVAEPTPLDRIAQAVRDAVASLFSADGSGGWGPAAAVIATVVVLGLVVAALLIWGRPRSRARSRTLPLGLFGADEERSASALRADAAAAAAREDWDDAVVLRTRALARGLAEREIVETPPGATVHAFARAAGRAFPAEDGALHGVADLFDDVRYLRRPGTADGYARVTALDESVAAARPATVGATA